MVFFKNWNKKYSNLKIKLFNTITDIVGLPPGKPTIRAIRFSLKDVLELLAVGMTNREIPKRHLALAEDNIRLLFYMRP